MSGAGEAPDEAPQASPLVEARRLVEASRFEDAVARVRALLARDDDPLSPEDRSEARYIEAVALRFLGDLEAASAALDVLLETDPENARAWQERGHLETHRGAVERAGPAFERAVALNPALIGSWRALAKLHRLAGRPREADAAAHRADALGRLPKELLSATSLLHEDRLYRAERLCRSFLRREPKHVEGMRLLAEIGVRLDVLDDAEFLLESALEFEPDHDAARMEFVNVLIRRQKFARALEVLAPLLERHPEHLPHRVAEALATVGLGDHERGIELYDAILARTPEQPQIHVSRGHALKTVGRLDEAVESYRQGYRLRSDFGDAFWSLANTKTYRFTDAELDAMREQEARPECAVEDRIHLCFAAGKAFEDRGEHEESFAFYERGNRLKRDAVRYTAEQTDRRIESQKEICTAELFEARTGTGVDAPDPIFVIGMPRAGSTLLEQILASHSQVDGTMELPTLPAIAQRLRGRSTVRSTRYPRILCDLDASTLAELGHHYLEEARIYRSGAPFFVDKMPNNFFHLGLIRLILPKAKIIDARRHPMACCFSGFKQLFGEGQEFSYGLTEIGHYYRRYVELMDHWDEALPGFVLRVQHEDVVDDLEGQVRRLLDFCGLPFEESCVEFHRTERSVRTPSSEQVRQPIYRSGLSAWRPYEPWLDPLKDALGDVLERYPITDRD
ncbi:MAG: sulfotransferase [Pseudomonadales bacterium]|jgi:tetratricopeptide (TPR) repeat protein|nr:sulfotransferase [Pseudomonadales bacterium]